MGNVDVVKFLMCRGVRLNHCNKVRPLASNSCFTANSMQSSSTALNTAANKEHKSIVEMLLLAGADPDIPDSVMSLPLPAMSLLPQLILVGLS